MPRVIDDSMVVPATRVLLGVVDVDGGATEEQRAVIALDRQRLLGPP